MAGLAATFWRAHCGHVLCVWKAAIINAPMLLFTGVCALSAWFVVQVVFGFGLVFPFAQQPFIHWSQHQLDHICRGAYGRAEAFYNLVLLRLTLWADHSPLMPQPCARCCPLICWRAALYPQVLVGFGISTLQLEGLPLPLLGLFGLLAVKMAFSWISFASGVSGGLLMPVLLIRLLLTGACMASGLLAADIIQRRANSFHHLHTLGMTGLFAGSVRAPLTGAFLLLEMTGAYHHIP